MTDINIVFGKDLTQHFTITDIPLVKGTDLPVIFSKRGRMLADELHKLSKITALKLNSAGKQRYENR